MRGLCRPRPTRTPAAERSDTALEVRETAHTKGKAIGDVEVSDEDMFAIALRLRDDERLSLREIASRLVIRTGKKRGRHSAPATVMRMLREHDEAAVLNPKDHPVAGFWRIRDVAQRACHTGGPTSV